MKRIGLFLLVLLFCASVVFATGGRQQSAPAKEITFLNGKIEIDAALKDYAVVYERQSGVRVNVRSFGGETSFSTNLTAILNSGTEPELYQMEGKAEFENSKRSNRLSDLSNELWVRDTDVAYIDPTNGQVVGFPVAIEGWGLGYNKALLDRAGINPTTLTNVNAIRAAFERLDSMKAQLGIDAVVSMAAGPGMTWVTGNHGMNAYLALGLPYNNSTRYLDMLLSGQVDTPRLTAFAEYYDMLFRYASRNTLLTGGYDQQLGDFAIGRTVFIHQGNWTDPTFQELGVSFEMGYIPHAFLTETTDGIFVGAPSFYIVNARASADGIAEAKKFLIAMAGTPEGHDYMVNKAGMVPAFKSVRLSPSGQFSRAVQQWSAQGKIYAWQQNDMPDGFGMDIMGPIFLQMAAGQINTQDFVRLATEAVGRIR